MIIIAKTKEGFIIEASSEEVKNVLNAVMGKVDMDKVGIGTKIPAIDYSATITKTIGLRDSHYLRNVGEYLKSFNEEFEQIKKVVNQVPEF